MTPRPAIAAVLLTPNRLTRSLASSDFGAYRGWWWFYGIHSGEAGCA